MLIYAPDGLLLQRITQPVGNGYLVAIAWYDDEKLALVYENGTILLFNDPLASPDNSQTLVLNANISECRIIANSLFALTNTHAFLYAKNIGDLNNVITLDARTATVCVSCFETFRFFRRALIVVTVCI